MPKDARLVIRLDQNLLDAITAAGQLNGHSAAAEARLAIQAHVAEVASTLTSDERPVGPGAAKPTAEQEPERARA